MKFTKMHGIGNDYIYVDMFSETLSDPARAAVLLSERHKGVGADGLILIAPSDKADVRMIMYNADGSQGMMCGNGVRCVGKYAYDHGIARKSLITVETASGIKTLEMLVENGVATGARVNMGKPVLQPALIPMAAEGEAFIAGSITVAGREYAATAVSMGNPHLVIFMEDIDGLDLPAIGPAFERHPFFPQRVNTEFVRAITGRELSMRVWERGSGETYACGTGACAAAVAGVLTGRCQRKSTVHLLGGDLDIFWSEDDGCVYMTGPAQEVFTGETTLI